MREIQSSVIAITPNNLKSGNTMYTAKFANGEEATTFEFALAQKAANTGGQVATFRIEDKPSKNGDRMYHNLIEVALPGEVLSPIIPQAGTPLQPLQLGSAVPAGGVTPIQIGPAVNGGGGGGGGNRGMSEADKIRITKLAGYGVGASGLVRSDYPTLAEYLAELDVIAQHVYKNARSHEGQTAPVPAPAPAVVAQEAPVVDPAALAAAAQAAGQPVQLGAAEVAPAAEPSGGLPWSTAG